MRQSDISQLGVGAVLEEVDERRVDCPNPRCDSTVDAQRIIALCPRPGAKGELAVCDGCGCNRDELFDLAGESDDIESPEQEASRERRPVKP